MSNTIGAYSQRPSGNSIGAFEAVADTGGGGGGGGERRVSLTLALLAELLRNLARNLHN